MKYFFKGTICIKIKNNELTKTIIYLLGHSDSGFRIIDIILKYNLQFNTVIEAINVLKKRKLIKIF